ncbi:hypothetical protein DFS34DRAFT_132632 [Phlyctochytrium arcticum]|nr:hypothetical protein DFS34DRAFT_132632 [Phlyctochytrium arcticum]
MTSSTPNGTSGLKNVTQLSKSTMSLKFMHRADEAKLRQEREAAQAKANLEAQWVLADYLDENDTGVQLEFESSYTAFLPSANFGRRSMGGFNKEIETMATESARAAQEAADAEESGEQDAEDDTADVSSKDMASSLSKRKGGDVESGRKAKRVQMAADSEPSSPGAAIASNRFRHIAKDSEEERVAVIDSPPNTPTPRPKSINKKGFMKPQ